MKIKNFTLLIMLLMIGMCFVSVSTFALIACPDLNCLGGIVEEPTGAIRTETIDYQTYYIRNEYEQIYYHCTECDIEGTYWSLVSTTGKIYY